MKDILIKNGKVILFSEDDVFVEKKDIYIQNGKIVELADTIEKNAYTIQAQNQYILPGLINTHTHLPMSLFRESFEGCTLIQWLHEKIWPKEDLLTQQDVYYATLLSLIEQISTGTTCTNDHYFFSETIRQAVEQSKIRAVLTRVLMDTNGNGNTRIEEFKQFYESRDPKNSLISYTVSPHGLYTCSGAYLEKIATLAEEYALPVHLHYLESGDELEDIESLHHTKPIELLQRYFSKTLTILAHGVKIPKEDLPILKQMNCSIAHNPVSNLRLGCKIADTTKYLSSGINVSIGTDGQGSGSNLDMFEAMRLACLIQGGIHEDENRLRAKDVIKMATINGAKALGMEDKIGSIEVGKQADLILVDLDTIQLDNITMLPNLNPISNLVYNATGHHVTTTIVNGEILMENGQIKHIDLQKVITECQKTVKRLGL